MEEKLEFDEVYFMMLGKEYLIKNEADKKAVLKKQKRIFKQTGKKPRIVASFRNRDVLN